MCNLYHCLFVVILTLTTIQVESTPIKLLSNFKRGLGYTKQEAVLKTSKKNVTFSNKDQYFVIPEPQFNMSLFENIDPFLLLRENCPPWFYRNAIGSGWSFINTVKSTSEPITKNCIKTLNYTSESVSKFLFLDIVITSKTFDEDYLLTLTDLFSKNEFTKIWLEVRHNDKSVIDSVLSIIGSAKYIETIDFAPRTEPSFESIKQFAKVSKTKHINVDKDLFDLLVPHSKSFENLESITIKHPIARWSTKDFNLEQINLFPNLTSIYNQDFFDKIMSTRKEINGVHATLPIQEDIEIPYKELKELRLDIEKKTNGLIDQIGLYQSKSTLKTLKLKAIDPQSSFDLPFLFRFLQDNTVLSNLSISFRGPQFINLNLFNLDLHSFSCHTSNFKQSNLMIRFIETQSNLKHIEFFPPISFLQNQLFHLFFDLIQIIILPSSLIKSIVFAFVEYDQIINQEYIMTLIRLIRPLVGRNVTINGVLADKIVYDLENEDIPGDLFEEYLVGPAPNNLQIESY